MKPITRLSSLLLLIALLSISIVQPVQAQADLPVIHAVLFYSPTCGHCHQVMTEDLPPLFDQYGNQLQIIGLDITTAQGSALFTTAIQYYQVPTDRAAVPFLVVGDTVLVGSYEIPTEFPGMIEAGLAAGGIAWPDFPGLAEVVAGVEADQTGEAEQGAATESTAEEPQAGLAEEPAAEPETDPNNQLGGMQVTFAEDLSVSERFMLDPTANTIAVLVLLAMLGSGVYLGLNFNDPKNKLPAWPAWVVPVLVAVGLIAAGYLAYVEITQTEAVCGPVGNCNAVQQSPYATLFGFLPIGILGLIGYVLILAAWGVQQYGPQQLRDKASLALLGLAAFGLLFSSYLTFLEPFVIGATCAWCITSAIVMTLILWAVVHPARLARRKL